MLARAGSHSESATGSQLKQANPDRILPFASFLQSKKNRRTSRRFACEANLNQSALVLWQAAPQGLV